MGIRKCIIKDCPSSSARVEDRGVTYHKIPANAEVKSKWMLSCRLPENYVINKGSNVCSRHFRKADFQEFKGTKYVLKFGAVPTIFSWTIASVPDKKQDDAADKAEGEIKQEKVDDAITEPPKQSEAESGTVVNDVKTVIKKEDPADEEIKHEVADDNIVLNEDLLLSPVLKSKQKSAIKKRSISKRQSTMKTPSASSPKKSRQSDLTTPTSSKDRKSTSSLRKSTPTIGSSSQAQINFTPGTKIEAQDFSGKWHQAKLGEVDTEEREVLVQFEKNGKAKLNDEWIPMDSVRLRPLHVAKSTTNGKAKFVVGEKCFARWSDSRKFRATIQASLDNDMYEVLFDDGFVKTCKATHISKLKKSDLSQDEEDLSTSIKQEECAVAESPKTPVTPSIALKIPQVAKVADFPDIPKDGEWCCPWMNDFPVGEEATIDIAGAKIFTVMVNDWRLPEGWAKHIYQRSSAYGKMDVILVNPEGKIFRSRQELKAFLTGRGEVFDTVKYDFGLHKKRAKELNLCRHTEEYKKSLVPNPVALEPILLNTEINIGSVKVKIIDNLLQCPEEDCLKTFRKENHLQIHIKHYHKELAKGLGEIPNMQDLATLRTPAEIVDTQLKIHRRKSISASGSKIPVKDDIKKEDVSVKEEQAGEINEASAVTNKITTEIPESNIKVEKPEEDIKPLEPMPSTSSTEIKVPKQETSVTSITADAGGSLDSEEKFETQSGIKPSRKIPKIKLFSKKKKGTKKAKAGFVAKRLPAIVRKKKLKKQKLPRSAMDYMDAEETQHSFGFGGNDSFLRHGYGYEKDTEASQTSASVCGQFGDDLINASSPRFINENGEVIKIVSMKKEEIINCICGYGEEDGLMVQCELCLCWQHGICNGFERDAQVPEKYVCYICRNPPGGRESRRYIHDQDWLYEGKLPVANYHTQNSKHAARFDILKQSHTLAGNLLELKRFMHSLKVKINIAENKDHPKMYLWSKKWENSPPRGGNGDLSGIVPLNNSIGTPTQGGLSKTEPIDHKPTVAPQVPIPEAPIDPAECQNILLEHIQKQQNSAMARLQAIEAQIIALEAYDDKPELLESPTAKNYPKTKQTIHMLLNDLMKVKKIAAIHRSAQQPTAP
ncbi:uncharacterized protein LOC129768456 [Toxorhynchites rutilus septentrionalis]|uniref:uncharacterized protein LOC129768456 n=1 Tax=Toxorhynchites rutilus septentrionalis TaxID=329112 RepID=UPI002479DCEF|nr:uncharacterized protein LOC129768456 [Toxorhynchites rutilus septentrionalis]